MNRKLLRIMMTIYPVLGAVIFIGLALLIHRMSAIFGVQLATSAILLYVGLAYVYHFFDRSLTGEVIVEYILLGLLIMIMVQSYLI